jgi:hypothetical protein
MTTVIKYPKETNSCEDARMYSVPEATIPQRWKQQKPELMTILHENCHLLDSTREWNVSFMDVLVKKTFKNHLKQPYSEQLSAGDNVRSLTLLDMVSKGTKVLQDNGYIFIYRQIINITSYGFWSCTKYFNFSCNITCGKVH